MADAVACAKAGQKVPQGYYNLELMTKSIIRSGEVLLRQDLHGRLRADRCRAGGGCAPQYPGRAGRRHPGGGPSVGVLSPPADLSGTRTLGIVMSHITVVSVATPRRALADRFAGPEVEALTQNWTPPWTFWMEEALILRQVPRAL